MFARSLIRFDDCSLLLAVREAIVVVDLMEYQDGSYFFIRFTSLSEEGNETRIASDSTDHTASATLKKKKNRTT